MKLCAWAEKQAYLRSNSKPVYSGHVIGHEMSSGRDFMEQERMEALCLTNNFYIFINSKRMFQRQFFKQDEALSLICFRSTDRGVFHQPEHMTNRKLREGGTPLYEVYRYVPPKRVWFLSRLGLKLGMVIEGTFTKAYKLIFLPSNRR